ncbi:MAG: DUF1641 domain-containing protein [Haloferacaceae archaeon]
MANKEHEFEAAEVLEDPETARLIETVSENATELQRLLDELVVVQRLAEGLAPELQDAARENREPIAQLRTAFEREETLVLLRTLGEDSEDLVELLRALEATQGLVEDLVPELVTVARENRETVERLRMAFEDEETVRLLEAVGDNKASIAQSLELLDASTDLADDLLPELITVARENRETVERMRMAFEREETLVLLERLGENTETLAQTLDLLDVTVDLADDLVPEVVVVARDNRSAIEDLRLAAEGFADAHRERDVDMYEFGQSLANVVALTETLGDPDVAESLDATLGAFAEDDPEPVGLFGLLGALRDAEVKRGLGRLVEALRRLGRT